MNILIAGIHSFVGYNLVNALKGDHSIYGVDILSPKKEGIVKTFSWRDVSMRAIPEIDVIIHLAGKAYEGRKKSCAGAHFDINTDLTKRIFDHFLESSAKRFIFFSSAEAVVNGEPQKIVTEELLPNAKDPYGESKIKAEEYIRNVCQTIGGMSKRVYILRPCLIHGPGKTGNLNLLYSVVRKGIPWPLGGFENRRSFTSVDNLCFVIDGLLTKDVPSGIYHIGDDEALSTNEMITVMCEAMGKHPRIWKLNKGFMEGCATVGSVLHLPLNRGRLRKLTENYVVSNTKIKIALGIERMPVSAREGLLKTIRSFEGKR